MTISTPRARVAGILLRIGIAFAFLYPPFDALQNPDSWIGYFPKFMHGLLPDPLLLHAFGLFEVVLACFIIFGRKIFWPSLLASALLLAIVLLNLNNFEVLFRDVSLALAALALAMSAEDSPFPLLRTDTSAQ